MEALQSESGFSRRETSEKESFLPERPVLRADRKCRCKRVRQDRTSEERLVEY